MEVSSSSKKATPEIEGKGGKPNIKHQKPKPGIQKPVGPNTIRIQKLREKFVNANKKGIITKEQYEQFNNLYKTWFVSKGKDTVKKQLLKQIREVYKTQLFQIIKDAYKSQ